MPVLCVTVKPAYLSTSDSDGLQSVQAIWSASRKPLPGSTGCGEPRESHRKYPTEGAARVERTRVRVAEEVSDLSCHSHGRLSSL